MTKTGRPTVALVLGILASIPGPAAIGKQQVLDPCDNVRRCREVGGYEVHPLPGSVTHYSCDSNGQAPSGAIDETADLQAWIDSVSDGKGNPDAVGSIAAWHVLDFPNGRCIRMDGHLTIQDRHNLIFDGDGVFLDQHLKPSRAGFSSCCGHTTNGSGGWHVIRGSFLQWHSFTLLGNHRHEQKQTEWSHGSNHRQTKVAKFGMCHEQVPGPPSNRFCEWQHGWNIMGSRQVVLRGNSTMDTHGESVAIEWGPGIDVFPRDILIDGHSVVRTGRQGISVIAGENITITNSYIEGSASNAIDLEPERWEDDRFPIRRVTITHNRFGEGHATVLVANGKCAEISDIEYSHNEQLEPNISGRPAIEMIAPSHSLSGASCLRQRGPVTIRDNIFRIQETGSESDVAALIDGYSNVTFKSNAVLHACHPATPGCTADQPPLSLRGGSGHMVQANNLSVGHTAHHWQWAYSYNGVTYKP